MSAAMINPDNLFEGMDDLDNAQVRGESLETKVAKATAPMIVCPRCAGRKTVTWGYVRIQSGPCNQCKGTGMVRADWQKRRAAFQKGEATKAQRAKDKVAQWQQDNPAEAAWLKREAFRSDFARSLEDGLHKYGRLTDGQMAAVRRSIAKDAEFKTKREADMVAAQVDTHGTGHNKLVAALNHAKARGMKRQPCMIVGDVDFQRAPDHGKNPGCVYVKARRADIYLGKITAEGMFQPSRECDEALKAKIAVIMLDPLTAAIEHGKLTGECSCCGRKLTDPVSVANGIGPICAEGFGF